MQKISQTIITKAMTTVPKSVVHVKVLSRRDEGGEGDEIMIVTDKNDFVLAC